VTFNLIYSSEYCTCAKKVYRPPYACHIILTACKQGRVHNPHAHHTAVTVLVLLTADKCSQTYHWSQMHLKRNRPSYFNRNGLLFPYTSFTDILLHNGFHIPHLKQTSMINHKSWRNMWLLATCPVVHEKINLHLPHLLKNNFTTLLHCTRCGNKETGFML